jgi:predicted component of type VI protein secretion system
MLVPVAALAPALALLAGCSSEPETPPPPPKVDFTVAARTVTAKPFLYCNVEIEDCKRDTAAQVKLEAAPGTAVKVRVPKEIADTPWSVVIQYRDAAGVQQDPRTVATFGPGKQDSFEAKPPTAGDQLQTVEVKQAGGKLIQGESGPEAVTRGVWSAQVEPA